MKEFMDKLNNLPKPVQYIIDLGKKLETSEQTSN